MLHRERIKENLPSCEKRTKSVHYVPWYRFDIVNEERKGKRKKKKGKKFISNFRISDVLIIVRVFRERERERGTGSKLRCKIWQIYEDKLGEN